MEKLDIKVNVKRIKLELSTWGV